MHGHNVPSIMHAHEGENRALTVAAGAFDTFLTDPRASEPHTSSKAYFVISV